MEYDAVIAGASFAGLTVASKLKGNILLIDKKEIGTRQTSACGTFYKTLGELNCEKSVLQIFNEVVLHHGPKIETIELIEPICTFDYNKFCQILADRIEAEKIKAVVKSVRKQRVITNVGEFQSRCIVDCTGWQAILASSVARDFVDKNRMSYGIWTVVDYKEDKPHFFLDQTIIEQGVAWIFPMGKRCGAGVASYVGKTSLAPELMRFLSGMGLKIGKAHGGFIPYGLREPVVENIFLVGDSASQAPPLTAEGIRKSVYFGKECGKIIQKVIDGKITLKRGLKEYRNFVDGHRSGYDLLLTLQKQLVNATHDQLNEVVGAIKIFAKFLQKEYLSL